MSISFDPNVGRISPMRTGRFAAPEKKTDKTAGQAQDQMEISQAGRQAAEDAEGGPGFDQLADQLSAMTKEEFTVMVREQLGEQKLEVNWHAAVDPDGSIGAKTYIESLASQYEEARGVIENYYADAYQEALHSPLGSSLPSQLNFIAGKYQCSWSDFFDASMPANERQWTYNQVRAMLTGTGVKVNDPYALKDAGLDTRNFDKIARQAAVDKIDSLIRQAKKDAGVTD